jgi:hypothetical protein
MDINPVIKSLEELEDVLATARARSISFVNCYGDTDYAGAQVASAYSKIVEAHHDIEYLIKRVKVEAICDNIEARRSDEIA